VQKTVVLERRGRRFVIRSLEAKDSVEFMKFNNALAREKMVNPDLDTISPDQEVSLEEAESQLRRLVGAVQSGGSISLGAFEAETLVGTADIIRPGAAELHHTGLFDIAVLAGSRGVGLGAALAAEALAMAQTGGVRVVMLRVFSTNARALALYEKLGFVRAGEIPGFIMKRGRPIDDVIMYKELKGNDKSPPGGPAPD
jgi:ribosomal protein S18 acetylase RimI-like enzyme